MIKKNTNKIVNSEIKVKAMMAKDGRTQRII